MSYILYQLGLSLAFLTVAHALAKRRVIHIEFNVRIAHIQRE